MVVRMRGERNMAIRAAIQLRLYTVLSIASLYKRIPIRYIALVLAGAEIGRESIVR